MAEYRFSAISSSGKTVVGIIHSSNIFSARQRINEIAQKNQLRIRSIEKKSIFLYKAKKPGTVKPILGEQKAYTAEEVEQALRKLGYEVIFVRKKLLDFQLKPPTSEIVSFVRISADLLKEKMSYGEILQLMINDVTNKTLRDALKDINNDLKKGEDSEKVFRRYEHVLGKFTAYMLGLASKSGNMAEIYLATAKFLERNQEFRKNLRSALVTPTITVIALILTVIYYVAKVFPATAELFLRFDIELPPLTAATLKLSHFLQNNFLYIILLMASPFLFLFYYSQTTKGKIVLHKWLLKLPVLGNIVHKSMIEIFCRVFYSLYTGSAENIEPIRIAAEATGNKYFEDRIKNVAIPIMIREGKGLTEAFEAAGVFTKTAISRFHAGEETGTIRNVALQIANYYESETTHKLKFLIEAIQLAIAMFIMIVITALTLISAETATIRPKYPGMSFIINLIQGLL
ncbi:MAG: type II secretion system F family protein [Ignavibacteria bacterium]|nr:type II secretion system F family protein [Ignavibacteria bacterium]